MQQLLKQGESTSFQLNKNAFATVVNCVVIDGNGVVTVVTVSQKVGPFAFGASLRAIGSLGGGSVDIADRALDDRAIVSRNAAGAIVGLIDPLDGSVVTLGGVSGGGATATLFSTAIKYDIDYRAVVAPYQQAGALAFTQDLVGSIIGGGTDFALIADGVNVPSFAALGLLATAQAWSNVAGQTHAISAWRDAGGYAYGMRLGAIVGAPLVVPGAATLAAGVSTTTTQPLTITAPATGGSPTSYAVFYKRAIDPAYSAGPVGASLTPTVTGLTASTSYNFKVVASNATGAGPDSNVVTNSTAAASTGPVTKTFTDNTGAGNVAGAIEVTHLDPGANTGNNLSGTLYWTVAENATPGASLRGLFRLKAASIAAQIPAGSTINSVSIVCPVETAGGPNCAIELRPTLRPWVVTQATDVIYATGGNWAGVVASGAGDTSASIASNAQDAYATYTWSGAGLVAALQAALNGVTSLELLLVAVTGIGAAYRVFDKPGSADGTRPTIIVNYT